MASPFAAYSVLNPADNSLENLFPALNRADKVILGGSPSATGGILGTISPYGTTTTGWRENQLNDDSWLAQNAYATSATMFNRDDTGKVALACTQEISGPYFRWMYAAAAANPITWTELMRLAPAGITMGTGVTGSGIVLNANPTAALQAAPKQYADATNSNSVTGTAIATGSASMISTGLGFALTPSRAARVFVHVDVVGQNTIAGIPGFIQIFRNTTGVPAQGTAVGTDTVISSSNPLAPTPSVSQNAPGIAARIDTSVTLGTTYYYYLAYQANAGSFNLTAVELQGIEF